MRNLMLCLVAAGSMCCPKAGAQTFTGNELYSMMQTPSQGAAARMYLLGFMDGLRWAKTVQYVVTNRDEDFLVCVPPAVNLEQVYDVTKAYLAANAATRHGGAFGLVAAAVLDAWPCRK